MVILEKKEGCSNYADIIKALCNRVIINVWTIRSVSDDIKDQLLIFIFSTLLMGELIGHGDD